MSTCNQAINGPNAQYNLAKPESVSIRVATRMRKQMFKAFIEEFSPNPAETILDIGVTSDPRAIRLQTTSKHCIPTRIASQPPALMTPAFWRRSTQELGLHTQTGSRYRSEMPGSICPFLRRSGACRITRR